MRLTLADVRQSDLPNTIGIPAGNLPAIAAQINRAQQRLILAGGDTGWWGGWAPVVFSVSQTTPYITLPREFARAIGLDWCTIPMRVNNQFWEYLPAGPGLMQTVCAWATRPCWCGNVQGYDRGMVPTMVDVPSAGILRAYPADSADDGKHLIIFGTDANDLAIRQGTPDGELLTLDSPFADTVASFKTISSIEKDITTGDVVLKWVDPTTGVETLLSRYAPTEVNPSYRRYQISRLPASCCPPGSTTTIPVSAICKLEFFPIYRDTDQLIIGNIEALIEECQAIRFSKIDNPNAVAMSVAHHRMAIKHLQNELRHYLGDQDIAVTVERMGTAVLSRQSIGTLI